MKLRLKTVVDPGNVHRIDVADGWTVAQLQDQVTSSILPGAASLSLNKKDCLGPADATLRSLGIRSGDTIWALQAEVASGPAGDPAAAASGPTPLAAPVAAVRPVDPSTSTAGAQRLPEPVQQQQQQHQHQQASAMELDALDSETHQVAAAAEELEQQSQALPAHLARLLATTQQQLHGVQWLLLAVHAAMLETGFQACPAQLPAEVVAAAGAGRDVCLGYRFEPAGTCPADASAPSTPAAAAGAGGGDAGPSLAQQGQCSVRVLQLGSHTLLVAAAQQQPATSSAAMLGGAAGMGSWQLVGTHTLLVDKYIATAAAAAAAAAAGGSPDASSSGAAASAAMAGGAYRDLQGLWVWVKDQVCLPLLAATCRMWGWPPPWGLTTLPSEVLELLLQQLPAKQLARVCCVSSGLRTAAAADALWDPLYKQEFPGASAVTRMNGPRLGWKWAFAYEWRVRVERERERDRARRARAHHPPGPPWPGIMPWGPARPRHPMQPPHIIGGDYDRLPPPLWGAYPSGGNGAQFGGLGAPGGGGLSSGPLGLPQGAGGAPGAVPGWMAGGLGAAGLPSGFGGGARSGRSAGRDWRLP